MRVKIRTSFSYLSKTVSDIAYDAIVHCINFNKITVYGLLIDYKKEQATKVYKMECDYSHGTVDIISCDNSKVDIVDAFQRVSYLISNAVIERN